MTKVHLEKLRALMHQYKIDAYAIPSSDEFRNEYTPKRYKRLNYISGFTGSNGVAIIGHDKAALITDGRYIQQAQNQLSQNIWSVFDIANNGYVDVLAYLFGNRKAKLGLSMLTNTEREIAFYKRMNIDVIALEEDLIDIIWQRETNNLVRDIFFVQSTREDKLQHLLLNMQNEATHILLGKGDDVSWLLDIRVSDIPHTPILLAYALIERATTSIQLFTNITSITSETFANKGVDVLVRNQNEIIEALSDEKIILQADTLELNYYLSRFVKINLPNPLKKLKAVKNPKELQGMRQAAMLDSIAICEALSAIEFNAHYNLDELKVCDIMLQARQNASADFIEPSFETIAGFAANGAIIHYNPTPESNKIIEGSGLLLIDSGGHYAFGTTDVTRVLVLGNEILDEWKRNYTIVLKAHIALATAIFPIKATGVQLDAITRSELWHYGMNYAHGTGHGVGYVTSVHESPPAISSSFTDSFYPGMIVSNEPGYYSPGNYGIRLENLMVVESCSDPKWLKFDTITTVPFCKKLIDTSLLTQREILWLKKYYDCIKDVIYDKLSSSCKQWLDSNQPF